MEERLGAKIPYSIGMKDDNPFVFAGLFGRLEAAMNSPLHRANKPDLLLFIAAFVDCLCGVSNLSSSSISYLFRFLF